MNVRNHIITAALSFTVLLLTQCTEKKEKPKAVVDMENSYFKNQEELSKYDAKIKAAAGDEGLIIQYNYDKELLKSRNERLKLQIKKLSPDSVLDAPAPAAGGHGGGH